MIWWLAVAVATDDVQARLHALTAQKHACDDAIPALDARLAVSPDDAIRLRRADCRYQIGRLEWALEDVQAIAEPDTEVRVLGAILLARMGRPKEARRMGRHVPVDTPARARVDGVLSMARGEHAAAWAIADDSLGRWPTEPDTLRLAGELAALDPNGVTPTAKAALERPTRFGETYNRGVNRLNAGDGPGCLEHVAEAGDLAGPVEAPVLARLGHQCAALAEDLEAAAVWLPKAGGVGFADPNAVLRQGELMRRAGDGEGALLLFAGAVPVTPVQERLRDTGLVTLHLEAGRLDDALTAAQGGMASGVSRANLAVALRNAGRGEEALALLEEACKDMTGDDATRCYQTAARWRP